MEKTTVPSLQLITVRWWNATAYYAVSLAQWLQAAGHPVLLAGNPDFPPLQKAQKLNLPIAPELKLNRISPGWVWRNRGRLQHLINRQGIQVVNAHRPDDHFYFALMKNHFPRVAFIRTVGDVRPPRNHPINKWLHLQATDFFIFSCRANLERYRQVWPIPIEKTAIIYNGIDTQYFSPNATDAHLRQKLHIPDNAIVFGMVARFSPIKGHSVFLQAAARVVQKHPEAYFIISGEEVEISRNDLEQMAKPGIHSHLRFLDKQADVRPLLNTIDVGVVCSLGSEAISRITTEYLAMGKPVIASRVNVLPEMITDGQEGFIVPPGEAPALAEKMELLITHKSLRQQMSEQARRTACERFDKKVVLQQTLQIYRQVLERKKEIR